MPKRSLEERAYAAMANRIETITAIQNREPVTYSVVAGIRSFYVDEILEPSAFEEATIRASVALKATFDFEWK